MYDKDFMKKIKRDDTGVVCTVYGVPGAGMTNLMLRHMEKVLKEGSWK